MKKKKKKKIQSLMCPLEWENHREKMKRRRREKTQILKCFRVQSVCVYAHKWCAYLFGDEQSQHKFHNFFRGPKITSKLVSISFLKCVCARRECFIENVKLVSNHILLLLLSLLCGVLFHTNLSLKHKQIHETMPNANAPSHKLREEKHFLPL